MNEVEEVLSTVQDKAQAKEISGLRCFVLPRKDFYRIAVYFSGGTAPHPDLLRAGYEGYEFRASPLDEQTYFLCTKAESVLDEIWKDKFRG
jgi:hypothetical protein